MATCNNCNSDKKLELHYYDREGERWAYGDCLQCNLRHEFREEFSTTGEPARFKWVESNPTPVEDGYSAS